MKHIVFKKNGRVSIQTPAPKGMIQLGLNEDEFMDYLANRYHKDNPYFICETKDLPTRKYRNAWEVDIEKKSITINETKKKRIDAELLVAKDEEAARVARKKNKIQQKLLSL